MKNLISMLVLMAVLSLSTSAVHAQAPNFLWVEQAGGTNTDGGFGIATDGSGNSIITGTFIGPATFGDTTLIGYNFGDIFIAKYDANGNFLWAAQAGQNANDEGYGIAMDGSGNSIVTGYFQGTATFGDFTLTATGNYNIFIAKIDFNGNFLWAVQAGGGTSGGGNGFGIATDDLGNSIVTGEFGGTVTFGDVTLISGSLTDIFIAKYDAEGNFLWAAQAGSGPLPWDGDEGGDIATDDSGNIIMTGSFRGTVTFGGDTTLTSANATDILIAKFDANGNFLWAVQAGGTDDDRGLGIYIDSSGNSIVTGYFQGTAAFGDTTLTSAGNKDIFIAKYDAEGNFLWAVQAGGIAENIGFSISTDGSGNSIVTGMFNYYATFGDTTLFSGSGSDIFIAKYDGDGNFLWVVQAGGPDDNYGYGIATDGSGNSIVTGKFRQTATFGNITLTSAGSYDVFIAKLGPGVTGIEEEFTLPRSFNLWQNYPNPFNPITRIKYSIPESGLVTLKIYDLLGRVIKTLVNEFQEPNTYSVDFDASELSSGIYFYNLSVSAWLSQNGQSGNFSETRKMILMK